MTRLVLHIGSYRTGSTTVQQCLMRARRDLRSRGILYPKTGLHQDNAHHRIAWGVTGKDAPRWCEPRRFDELLGMLSAEIQDAGCHTVIISTETLANVVDQSADEEVRRRLGRLLALFSEVNVVCCVRHQAPLMESLYRFIVAWQMTSTTNSFAECVAAWSAMPHLTYANTEQFFHDIRPDARFRWWSFSEAVAAREFVRRFYGIAGIEDSYRGEHRVNESLSREATLAILEWNRATIDGRRRRKAFSQWATSTFPEVGTSLYDSELLNAVVDRFRESNALLEKRAGVRFLDTPVPSAMADRLAGHTLQPDELVRVGERIRRGDRWPWSWRRGAN